MKSAYPPHGLRRDASLFPHFGTSSSDDAYSGRPPLNSCKIFPHQCVKGREPRVNRRGDTAMVKREPGDMVGGILQLLARPCSRRRDRIRASNMGGTYLWVKLAGAIFRLVGETHLIYCGTTRLPMNRWNRRRIVFPLMRVPRQMDRRTEIAQLATQASGCRAISQSAPSPDG
jgi:hypothetical protein